jgi:hypothetical protein
VLGDHLHDRVREAPALRRRLRARRRMRVAVHGRRHGHPMPRGARRDRPDPVPGSRHRGAPGRRTGERRADRPGGRGVDTGGTRAAGHRVEASRRLGDARPARPRRCRRGAGRLDGLPEAARRPGRRRWHGSDLWTAPFPT